MIKWSELRARISRALANDPTFTNDDLKDYVNQALTAISSHTAQERILVLQLQSDTIKLDIPDDMLELGPILAQAGVVEQNIYRPYRLKAGQSLPLIKVGNQLNHYYYRWGDFLQFLTPVLGGRTLTLHYYSYWQRVERDEDEIKIKRWMEEALVWYCLHLAMGKAGFTAAKLRQWNIKEDSGNPLDNSPQKYAQFCLNRYQSILNEAPQQDRTGWGEAEV